MDNYKVFHISVRGSEHTDQQALMEDCSGIYEDKGVKIAVTAGGRSDSPYFRSYIGAQFVKDTVLKSAAVFAKGIKGEDLFGDERAMERLIRQLEGSIITGWQDQVHRHLESYPFQDEEIASIGDEPEYEKYIKAYKLKKNREYAYSATVVAVIVTEEYCLAMRNGNGDCAVIYEDESMQEPIPLYNGTHLTSICDEKALWEFRHVCLQDIPKAVFISTQGIGKCFKNRESFHSFIRNNIVLQLTDKGEEYKDFLQTYLSELSRRGSREDMSMAVLWNTDVKETKPELIIPVIGETNDVPLKEQSCDDSLIESQENILNQDTQEEVFPKKEVSGDTGQDDEQLKPVMRRNRLKLLRYLLILAIVIAAISGLSRGKKREYTPKTTEAFHENEIKKTEPPPSEPVTAVPEPTTAVPEPTTTAPPPTTAAPPPTTAAPPPTTAAPPPTTAAPPPTTAAHLPSGIHGPGTAAPPPITTEPPATAPPGENVDTIIGLWNASQD